MGGKKLLGKLGAGKQSASGIWDPGTIAEQGELQQGVRARGILPRECQAKAASPGSRSGKAASAPVSPHLHCWSCHRLRLAALPWVALLPQDCPQDPWDPSLSIFHSLPLSWEQKEEQESKGREGWDTGMGSSPSKEGTLEQSKGFLLPAPFWRSLAQPGCAATAPRARQGYKEGSKVSSKVSPSPL